jgi:hypothetical protein
MGAFHRWRSWESGAHGHAYLTVSRINEDGREMYSVHPPRNAHAGTVANAGAVSNVRNLCLY